MTTAAVDERVLAASRAHIESLGDAAEDAFYTIDLQHVADQYWRMVTQLPRVLPFYTVKCHPDTRVLSLLAELGAGVDCASQSEVALSLSHGVPPERIIFANTMKQRSHLRFAREHHVPLTVFDSTDELVKIQREFPEAKLLLRLQVDDSKARHQFGPKFGARMADVPALLETAKRLELNVVGVCFHVGVGVLEASAFVDAIVRAKQAFAMGLDAGFEFALLNLGGGFAGDDLGPVRFEAAAQAINAVLDELFPEHSGVDIISEPGRYFVSACASLTVNVIGRKVDPELTERSADEPNAKLPRYMYMVNDGRHGSFSTPHLCVVSSPAVLKTASADEAKPVPCSVWGPTMDGKDAITRETSLPVLQVGDWITFPRMGAYSFATGSTFNGFSLPCRVYIEASSSN
ncbi:Mitochondrial 2-oxoadipate and 2-oxoglutarate transporter [Phytophthora pseudosyringae]|uniref:Mitochondrial 2-oxoadipate and 2-oxoglutarate transporter n=1 Tax=Phytophthora pseudosyringae TaxID=221518 RepID=A0A8T1WK10_9STRA|nr:Mitochondrial 2-oxoadipate and 2-oxoglutarate transporter [Phytophthora pseudosyringae]